MPISGTEQAYPAQGFVERGQFDFLEPELYDFGLVVVALVILIAALLPRLFSYRQSLTPLMYASLGGLVFLFPAAPELPDLVEQAWLPKRLTELGVIVSLTAVGLKLNAPLEWKSWRVSWRLLVLAMPLTVAASVWLGWWMAGLVPASALLLGAVTAPTDPVLAADVQTSAPGKPEPSDTHVALTTEAGLNDGLAFPFTHLAIAVALVGLSPSDWLAGWLTVDVFYRIVAGTLIGAVSGFALAQLIFRLPAIRRMARTMTGILALSLTLLPYGLAELAAGYGFIAVFVAACVFRRVERDNEYQLILHDFSEEIERVLVSVLMFLVGAYAVSGLFDALTLPMLITVVLILFAVRPAVGMLSLVGSHLSRRERWTVSFFGIRGIGSIYYLSFGVFHADFPEARALWAMVLAMVLLSVLVYGFSARPAMDALAGEQTSEKAARNGAQEDE